MSRGHGHERPDAAFPNAAARTRIVAGGESARANGNYHDRPTIWLAHEFLRPSQSFSTVFASRRPWLESARLTPCCATLHPPNDRQTGRRRSQNCLHTATRSVRRPAVRHRRRSRPVVAVGLPRRSFAAGSANPFDRQGRIAGLFGDKPVLFFQDRERGSIKVDAAEHRTRDPAIGSLRTVFIEHVKRHEFGSGSRFSGHFFLPWVSQCE
jgi:hypothetical protein